VDSEPPHRQAVIGPPDLRRYPDWHRLVDRFENTDRAGELAVPYRPGSANVGEVCWTHRMTGFESHLATVVAAWPNLLEAIRAGIVAMVKAASK